MSDADLVARAAAGDAAAFGQLYEAHAAGVYHFVHFRVGDVALAEDLTHDVWLQALDHLGELKDAQKLRAWLLAIAHRRVLNHWRRQRGRAAAMAQAPDAAGDPAASEASAGPAEDEALAAVADRLDAAAVLAATERLTDLQRQVIGLRFVAGLSLAETAAAMDHSVGAVKNLQHNALAALRRHLDTRPGDR